MYHIPVLLHESIDLLAIDPAGVYVDLTLGGAGHTREILSRLASKGRLISFDQDTDALANAPRDKRLTLIHNNFKYIHGCLRAAGFEKVDGILADLGVSSHHFDTPERGFSFRFQGEKLDMRMNQLSQMSAQRVVNEYPIEKLAQIMGRYGELDNPFRIAKAIEAARPMLTVEELLSAVEMCTPRGGESKFRAKLFQALRLEVNGEIAALEMMLNGALASLREGGSLSIISYHSLEDRLVKNFMKSGNFEGKIEKDYFGNALSPFTLTTRKAVEPSGEEIERNPRARSAKLRAAQKREITK